MMPYSLVDIYFLREHASSVFRVKLYRRVFKLGFLVARVDEEYIKK
jgi:hypothetical protein